MSLGASDDVKRAVKGIMNRFDFERRDLDQTNLKQLKSIVKGRGHLLVELKELLWKNLRVRNCDQRLCVVLIVDYFFQRSHDFRLAVLDGLYKFLLNTVEIEPKRCSLPGPPAASSLLRREATTIVKLWVDKFGPAYPQLPSAKTMILTAETKRAADVSEEEEANRIAKAIRDDRGLAALNKDYNETAAHIREGLLQGQSILKLLVPDICDDVETSGSVPSTSMADVPDAPLSITIGKQIVMEKTEDNQALIENLYDSRKLLPKHLAKVESWISRANKHGASAVLCLELHTLLKELKALQSKLADIKIVEKRETVLPQSTQAQNSDAEDVSDDDDGFEDVDLRVVDPEGLNVDKSTAIVPLNQLEDIPPSIEEPKEVKPPILKRKSPSPIPGPSKPVIPTLSYGLDLKYWGQDVEPAEKVKNQFDGHRFWRPPVEEANQESSDVYRSRVMTYVGEMPAITRSCRAPLASGSLCPRMDRFKCPLHGPIVDRDELGQRADGKSDNFEKLTKSQQAHLEAEEEAYYRDLEKQTGGKFNAELAKGKRKRAKVKPKKREKSEAAKTRDRLKTKLFNKKSLRRVTETLETIQKNKAAQKFGHQFNYL
uniref:UV-stimulated scaffold protein A n=1 Tax=Panagrellus redivivus TaxID=6233 RepID=A0A7E4URU5_PANRE